MKTKTGTTDLTTSPLLDFFARTHSLRRAVLRDSSGAQLVVLGRPPKPRPEDCSHIFEHSPGKLGLCLLLHSARAWSAAKKKLLAVGFELAQDGEGEGILLFDPNDPAQAKAAIKACRARRVTRLSPETVKQRSDRMKALRAGPMV